MVGRGAVPSDEMNLFSEVEDGDVEDDDDGDEVDDEVDDDDDDDDAEDEIEDAEEFFADKAGLAMTIRMRWMDTRKIW